MYGRKLGMLLIDLQIVFDLQIIPGSLSIAMPYRPGLNLLHSLSTPALLFPGQCLASYLLHLARREGVLHSLMPEWFMIGLVWLLCNPKSRNDLCSNFHMTANELCVTSIPCRLMHCLRRQCLHL
jgi:hypothetical protein